MFLLGGGILQPDQNQFSMEDAIRLAGTPAGQQLINLLKSSTDRNMDSARKAVEAGDMEQAKKSLSGLLKSPDIQKLLKELENSHG